ncbi:hypothetical protein ABZ923_16395 [Streptomyces sp. NPDC046881]|uniref:hypothetical protein n=1 Tax=Streptomyces sp. NPDC046881 TaxID=3155374 RepID=UPI0034063609
MRSGRTATVLAVLLLGAVACTAPRPGGPRAASPVRSPASPSCPSGTFRWGAVRQETRLTGVSPVVTVGAYDGWTTFRNVPVRTIVASVRTNGVELSGQRTMASLARHLGYDTSELMAPGESTARHPRHPDRIRSDGAGRFVTAEAVKAVDASFAVTCPDGTHYGSVTTWLTGTRGDSLACGTDPGGEAWVREAYRLACGPVSR